MGKPLFLLSKQRPHRWLSVLVSVGLASSGNSAQSRISYAEFEIPEDPGVRGGRPSAGAPLQGLKPEELTLFGQGREAFTEIDSVRGDEVIPGTSAGLGPRFNSDSCVSCHNTPAVGGSSPPMNPLFEVASRQSAKNIVPFFLTPQGPAREARFKFLVNPNGSLSRIRDGGVHNLFTITGRTDAPGCVLAQPDFEREALRGNLSLRIPTPVFGAGLIEAISDRAILDSFFATERVRRRLGIGGHPNIAPDGTISRFGWKAQTPSLMIFAAEAYNVEMGVTNALFPQERETSPACRFNATPEDGPEEEEESAPSAADDVFKFAGFMRMLAPPTPAPENAQIVRGRKLFLEVGCALCHTPELPIANNALAALGAQKKAVLFSDLMLHRMGARLADDIIQGSAGPDEFRTAPLWGVGQRVFFLHDGRTRSLLRAIEWHSSAPTKKYPPSEANGVISRFNALSDSQKQDILNFLRGL